MALYCLGKIIYFFLTFIVLPYLTNVNIQKLLHNFKINSNNEWYNNIFGPVAQLVTCLPAGRERLPVTQVVHYVHDICNNILKQKYLYRHDE